MGLRVIPRNINERQKNRVLKIGNTDLVRADRVADRISDRRANRGIGESTKAMKAKVAMAQPMKKGGKIIKKAQYGFNLGKAAGAAAGKVTRFKESVKKAGEDIKQAERNYKTADSLRNVKPKMGPKGFNAMMNEQVSRKEKADSLYKAGRKLERLDKMDGYKSGGKMKKAKSGGSFPDLNKDGKITKADILKGRGVIAKSGTKMKTKANYGKSMMSKGGKMKMGGKCKNGC